ncbi:hypothetical protein [Halopiger xanaduensis]|uniref:Uncharacterized protein n=1 Tax=Halopiger xanaduensis (strain DSM 18323 / JCM 14033 / SH-6) TaxID=797210 RepID=F8DEQ6_HALXS|nr:hypothetical protein [Halopiger xanaduensis]AEH39493.1 hypothetical protein Halxa_0253 [Halopiger xanaduensis SH-6]
MSKSVAKADGVYRATCEACAWTLERALDAGSETVTPEDNQDIVERVAANHAHRCPASGEEWTDTVAVDVTMDLRGGAE